MYGLTIPREVRDRLFDPQWREAVLLLPTGEQVIAELRPTFWTTCSEIRGAAIGRLLQEEHLIPWPDGTPPSLDLTHQEANRFHVTRPLPS